MDKQSEILHDDAAAQLAMPERALSEQLTLPVLPLRGVMVFPNTVLHFDVGREKSVAAIDRAMETDDQRIFLTAQKDASTEDPVLDDLYSIGTVVMIKQVVRLQNGVLRVVGEGVSRAVLDGLTQTEPFLIGALWVPAEPAVDPLVAEAHKRMAMEVFEAFAKHSGKPEPQAVMALGALSEPGLLADAIAANTLHKLSEQQAILEELDPIQRLLLICRMLQKENELQDLTRSIREQVKERIDKNQKEYYLREQMKVIQKELGDGEGGQDELRTRLKKAVLPDAVRQKVEKELSRLSHIPSSSPEVAVLRTWIEWVLDLPFGVLSNDNYDIALARAVLDEDHYGLKPVKERVLEYLAVLSLRREMKGPILCFVGPPGVGKTSVGRSIARALGRKFVRMSLGGVRDEAEIRGHRRTYVGAIPGRVMSHIKQAGSQNPVFLLDEIDKLASDFRGDPAAALLEVLDAEQNHAFEDHYLEIPFDLSRVMFLATANTTDTIPQALLDRMEVIELPGYTEDEKLHIAQGHLVPKQRKEHGLKASCLKISDEAVLTVVRRYTREAGVRQLERQVARVCRKAAVRFAEGQKTLSVSPKNLEKLLGVPRYRYGRADAGAEVGVAVGLAYTGAGGDVLPIEATRFKGKGNLELTGRLGEVMKESAHAALSYVRTHAARFDIPSELFEENDIHIHVPEGAVPKDGPSAGVTLCSALVSALSGVPVRQDVAMTGEITLRGRILPIGGLKEKSLAAKRAGITTVLFPEENLKDLSEIEPDALAGLHMLPVRTMDDVLPRVLVRRPDEAVT